MASSNRLSNLSDRELVSRLCDLVRRESEVTLAVLLHLNEVERRRLHATLGYASLFDYCTERLGYSRSAAGRRIQVARCLRLYSEIIGLLERGELTLTTLSLLAPVLTSENRTELLGKARGKSQREVDRLVAPLRPLVDRRSRVRPVCIRVPQGAGAEDPATAAGTDSKAGNTPLVKNVITPSAGTGAVATDSQDARCKTASAENDTNRTLFGDATPSGRPEENGLVQAPEGPEKAGGFTIEPGFQITITVTREYMRKYETVRAFLSNRLPKAQVEEVFEALIDEFLEKHAPEKRIARREARRHGKAKTQGAGAGPAAHGKHMTERSGEEPASGRPCNRAGVRSVLGGPGTRCDERSRHIPTFVRDRVFARDRGRCTYIGLNGKRCESTHHLQVDHIAPFSRGGTNALSNLRLLCATHNQLEARRLLGEELIESRIRGRAGRARHERARAPESS